MAQLPTEDNLTNSSTTNAQQKTNFANLRNFIAAFLGTDSDDISTAQTKLEIPDGDDFVQLTGDQTVDGIKTFSSSPVVPTPSTGDSTTKAINSAWFKAEAATLTARGTVELATDAEAQAGTDTGRVASIDVMRRNGWVYLPRQNVTSQTELDFGTIPSWATEIQMFLVGFSTNGSGDIIVRLGTASAFDTSAGYSGAMSTLAGGVATTQFTTGFRVSTSVAGEFYSGTIRINLFDATDNTWNMESKVSAINNTRRAEASGHKALSAALTRVRLTSAGPDTMDAGSARVRYR